MTRRSRRELERAVEDLDDDDGPVLDWMDFMKLANDAAEPADYGLTEAEVTREWRAFCEVAGLPARQREGGGS